MLLIRILSILAPTLSAFPIVSPHVPHEARRSLPAEWSIIRRAAPTFILPLRIGLAQPNLEQIETLLLDVSHPDSPNYGNHWSPAEVAQKFRPSSESVDTVRNWLIHGGVDISKVRLSKSGGWLEANVTVEEAEMLLKTEYYVYGHDSGAEHIGCGKTYHLPEHVTKHVELVTPTLHFDMKVKSDPKEKRTDGPELGFARKIGQPGFGAVFPQAAGRVENIIDDLEHCDQQITPHCLRALYEFVYAPAAANKNTLGIVEYTPQAYIPSDLDLFFTNFSQEQVGERPVFVGIDGGILQTNQTSFNFNGESSLDLQYAMSLVGEKQPVTLYQVGDDVEGGSFNNLLDALDGSYCTFEGGDDPTQDGIYPDPFGGFQGPEQCGNVKPAHVISTSYSHNEADLTPAYTARQCAEYAKLGLMGVTVLYSSGDRGVGGRNNLCLQPDGSKSAEGKIFTPSFPGTCPFITSVGATQVVSGKKVTDPESACMDVIFSGGGFSNYFPMPDYQKSAVENYLTKFPPPYPADIWNSTGKSRAYPDVSANGANYVVAVDGGFSLVFGTSASTPVTASILSAVNDARLALNKKPIGFINPTIYSSTFQGAFNDIKNGTNPGCGTAGFSTAPGWDPVTGLGTPNFPKLLARWLLLP